MATSSPPTFWERLLGQTRPDALRERFNEDHPRHRGFVITVCILTSCLLWFIFSLQETYTLLLDLPTEIQNLPPDEALTALPPSTVRVQARGEGIPLLQLYYNPPTMPINASVQQIDLEALAPELTQNVRLETVSPRTVTVQKEPRITRKVPVARQFELQMAPTYGLLELPRLRPDSIEVSGASSIVQSLLSWPTERTKFTGVKDTLIVTLALIDTLQGLVVREVDEVVMVAPVQAFTEGERTIVVRVEGERGREKRVTLDPPTLQVKYQVPLAQYDQALEAEAFYASVSYDEIEADTTGRVYPRLHWPPGLALREFRFSPLTLQYYINVSAIQD